MMHKFHSPLENRSYQLGEQDNALFELNLIQLHSKRLVYYEIVRAEKKMHRRENVLYFTYIFCSVRINLIEDGKYTNA
jgi:hypothetical protein